MIRYVLVNGQYSLNEESIRNALNFNGQVPMFKTYEKARKFVAALEEAGMETKDLNAVKVSVKLVPQD